MPSFLKLATFVLGFFHCFQMYIRNLRRIHSSQNVSVRFICHTKIANPTTDRHFHFLHHSADIASTVSLCKKFQRFLCPGKRLSVFTTWLLLLPGAKPKNPHRFARWGLSVLPRKNEVCNYQADRQHNDFFSDMDGRGRRIRTLGTRFWRPLLYQLSYAPI